MDFAAFLATVTIVQYVEYARMPFGKLGTRIVLSFNGRQISMRYRGHLSRSLPGMTVAEIHAGAKKVAVLDLLDFAGYAYDFTHVYGGDYRAWAMNAPRYRHPNRMTDAQIAQDMARIQARAARARRWLSRGRLEALVTATRP